jgi:serine/threonine-protein kinase RsbW
MPCAAPCKRPGDAAGDRTVSHRFRSDPLAVRAALVCLLDDARLGPLVEDDRGTAEIVLAEALNNVVEHAYAEAGGEIEVTIRLDGTALHCVIRDEGRPMPGNAPPQGRLPEIRGLDDLPEGGFGWHLIRVLSQDLAYRRIDGRNELSFRLLTQTA